MNKPTQELITIPGPVGAIEAILHALPQQQSAYCGVVCHPHPLHQGNMHNKVVTTVIKSWLAMGIPCLRFNFRGVGNSAGKFDHGLGECDDCLAVIDWLQHQWPTKSVWLAGFSFGSYVAAAAAMQRDIGQLLMLAPPVDQYNFLDLTFTCPCLVVQGDQDEIVSVAGVYQWYAELVADKHLIKMADTSHFFHGKLVALQQHISRHYDN